MTKPQCKYKDNCFRLNPSHFEQYSHAHLDSILVTEDKDGNYTIPEELEPGTDKILQQLEILKTLQKKNKRNEKDEIPHPAKIIKVEPASQQSPSSSKSFKSSPKTPKLFKSSPSASQSTTQPLDSKENVKSTVNDYFAERRAAFKAKDPEEMKAPPSTSPKPEKPQSSSMNELLLEQKMRELLPVIAPRGRMAEKLKNAAPYNVFLTTVTDSPQTHNDPLSITFLELLDPSLGELESSIQFNFMVEPTWLMAQYTFAKVRHLPLLILYGDDIPGLADIGKKIPNVTAVKIRMPTPIGCHHTKMMFFFYKDQSMRVVVSTANLYEDDWHNRVQGLWISEKLPSLPEGVSHVNNGESMTGFREDLLKYLHTYNLPKLQPAIARVRSTDFSSVKVFFIASTPGTHHDMRGIHFGHPRAAQLLAKHSAPIDDTCPIIIQASSIGSLGPQPSSYLLGEITQAFRKDSAPVGIRKQPPVNLIYPSVNNVLNSHDKILGGGCLPYGSDINDKQPWLHQYLYQWKSTSRNRNQAMPHIKSYCRYSDRGLYWFCLTSANISKSAWGSFNKSTKLGQALRINSYEAGVFFFPRVMIEKDRFPMEESQRRGDEKIFKLPFDIPPVPYGHDDTPFTSDLLRSYLKGQRH